MEDKDFDPRVLALADEYSWAITGGLLHTLWDKKEKFSDRDIEWVKANLLFFIKHCNETIAPIMKDF